MHAPARRSRGTLTLAGIVAALAAALVLVLPTATASANTVWHPAKVPSWVIKKCRTGTVICIDKHTYKLAYMKNGKALLILDARFGAASTPTREGTFKIYYKDINHVSSLYGSAMPYSMFFSGGEAIHFSIDFLTYGYAHHSHGCVNIRDRKAIRWLYEQVPVGTKVVIYH